MIDEGAINSLSITRNDWRALPSGYLRRRFGPALAFMCLCVAFSAMHFIDGIWNVRPDDIRKGIHALLLLIIPGILMILTYVDVIVDMKIIKSQANAKSRAL